MVLNVGHAHLGEFGSVEAIAQAKGELVEALTPRGWAVLNADDPLVAAMAARTRARLAHYSLTGEPAGDLRVWAEHVRADDVQRHSFTLRAAGAGEDGAIDCAEPVRAAGPGTASGRQRAGRRGAGPGACPRSLWPGRAGGAVAQSAWRMQLMPRAD